MENTDKSESFEEWLSSLPVGFIQHLYQIYQLNQLPDIKDLIENGSVVPINQPVTDRDIILLSKSLGLSYKAMREVFEIDI